MSRGRVFRGGLGPGDRRRHRAASDEGSALVLCLVFVVVVSLFVLPVMNYIMSVTRGNRVAQERAERAEAVRAGARAALLSPTQLYAACENSGRTTAVQLAVPPGLGIRSHCTTTADARQEVPSDLRYALTTTHAGSDRLIPRPYENPDPSSPELDGMVSPTWCTSMSETPQVPCGKPYPGNGAGNTRAWLDDASLESAGGKVFAPQLPTVSKALPSPTGYQMADTEHPCRVFFPGRYINDVVITGATPVYFVSGIYYFERTLRISGDANVVVGAGVVPGCVDSDSIAAFDPGAPDDAYSTGVGGTFVFGAKGRLVIDDAVAPSGPQGTRLVFNRRLVPTDDPLAVLNDISIMSVNGVLDTAAGTTGDLDLPGRLSVPRSLVAGTTPTDPWTHRYRASTLLPTPTPPRSCGPVLPATSDGCPIIDVSFSTPSPVTVKIPGYIAVPQGSVVIQTEPDMGVRKAVTFGGGILAAQIDVTDGSEPDAEPEPHAGPTATTGPAGGPGSSTTSSTVAPAHGPGPTEAPDFLQLGLLNPVVQKTFKITTTTTSGLPKLTWVTIVQVNEAGGWKINSSYEHWEI